MDAMDGVEPSSPLGDAGRTIQSSFPEQQRAAFDQLATELLCGIFNHCTFVELLNLRLTCKRFVDVGAHFAFEEVDIFRTEASIANFYKLAYSHSSRYVRRVNIYLDHIPCLEAFLRHRLPEPASGDVLPDNMRAAFNANAGVYAAALHDQVMAFSQSFNLNRFRAAFTGLENLEEVHISKLYPAHLSLFQPIFQPTPMEMWSTSAYINMLSLATARLKQLGHESSMNFGHSRCDESAIVAVVLDAINERAQRRGVRGHHLKILDITADISDLFMTEPLVMLGAWDRYVEHMRATQTTLHSIQQLRICMDPEVLSKVKQDTDEQSAAALQAVLEIIQARNIGVPNPGPGQPIVATFAPYSRSSYLSSQIMQ